MDYCQYIKDLPPDNLHKHYHDHHYGFPLHDDDALFGRLVLEIFQAGLNWGLILKKEENFLRAFDHFSIPVVARYGEVDRSRLMQDSSIIRNKHKINAAIHNAQVIRSIQEQEGSFTLWLNHHHPMSKKQWVRLFKKHFKFVGEEIVGEFLMSTGYLQGAHKEDCPIYGLVLTQNPPWYITA